MRSWISSVIFVTVLLVIPVGYAFAAPIVPECTGSQCRACDLVTLIQNVINFLIFASVFIAVLLFALSGFKAVMSGGHHASEAIAHTTMAVIGGILIALAAWLIVDTFLKAFTGGTFGPWNTIECVENPEFKKVVAPTVGPNVAPDGSEQGPLAVGDCSPDALSAAFGNRAAAMSCVIQGESGCMPGRESQVDRTADGFAFSVGLTQINMTMNDDAHNLNNPTCIALNGGQAPNCSRAFQGINRNARVVDQTLYNTCLNLAKNAECNIAAARMLLQTPQGLNHWSAYGNCRGYGN